MLSAKLQPQTPEMEIVSFELIQEIFERIGINVPILKVYDLQHQYYGDYSPIGTFLMKNKYVNLSMGA